MKTACRRMYLRKKKLLQIEVFHHHHLPKVSQIGSPISKSMSKTMQIGNLFWWQPILATHGLPFWLFWYKCTMLQMNKLLLPIFPVATFEQLLLLGFAFSAGQGPTSTYVALWVSTFDRYTGVMQEWMKVLTSYHKIIEIQPWPHVFRLITCNWRCKVRLLMWRRPTRATW